MKLNSHIIDIFSRYSGNDLKYSSDSEMAFGLKNITSRADWKQLMAYKKN